MIEWKGQLVGSRDSEKERNLTSDKDVSGEAEPIRWAITEDAREIAEILSDSLDADVIFYNGPLDDPYDWLFIEACAGRYQRENVFLILVTHGGSADSAFRIADWLQKHYTRFTLYVTGRCKSAGTLVAMGAHELIMSPDHGELGPLDVQLPAPEEPDGRRSGLTFSDALRRLDDEAYLAYENFLSRIIENDDHEDVSREYAMKIASDMATALYGQTYGQLDPLHVGQASRAMGIAEEYGVRLLKEGQNSDRERLLAAAFDYPSHGFVIGPGDAAGLFDRVYMPAEQEHYLAVSLGDIAIAPFGPSFDDWDRFVPFEFLSEERIPEDDERRD